MACNVLIVDNSTIMRALIRKVLTFSGLDIGSCFEGANGQEALNILEKHGIDVILSDLDIPEMNGSSFLQTLKDHDLWRSIPVVLITAESRQEVISPLLGNGARGYIKKPFKPEAIRNQLRNILGEAASPNVREFEGSDF